MAMLILFLPCCPVASSLVSLSPQSGPGPDPACPTTTTTTTTSSLTTSSVDENSNSPNVFSTPKRPSHLHITSPLLPRRDGEETNETAALTTQSSPCSLLLTSTSLSLPSPIASDFELSVLERFDQLMASLGSFTANHSGLLCYQLSQFQRRATSTFFHPEAWRRFISFNSFLHILSNSHRINHI